MIKYFKKKIINPLNAMKSQKFRKSVMLFSLFSTMLCLPIVLEAAGTLEIKNNTPYDLYVSDVQWKQNNTGWLCKMAGYGSEPDKKPKEFNPLRSTKKNKISSNCYGFLGFTINSLTEGGNPQTVDVQNSHEQELNFTSVVKSGTGGASFEVENKAVKLNLSVNVNKNDVTVTIDEPKVDAT